MMNGAHSETSKPNTSFIPLACLLGVVVLLSSVTPVVKYIFQHSTFQPIGLAYFRVVIGFVFLLAITWLCDRRGLMSLATADLIRLGCVGFLGVFSYAIAAWGLMHTSVIHYAFIYGLLPSCTAMLSVLVGKDRMTGPKCAGIVLSLAGCVVAISWLSPFNAAIQLGDLFVLLFTVMMSAHIVFTSGMVKRFGVMVSNTVMFGSSSVLLFFGSLGWSESDHQGVLSPLIALLVLYVGCATAAVFMLRCRSLQSLSPVTVGTYHNLIPVCTVLLAYLCLGEPIGSATIFGGMMVIAGAEMVRRPQMLALRFLPWTKPSLSSLESSKHPT